MEKGEENDKETGREEERGVRERGTEKKEVRDIE